MLHRSRLLASLVLVAACGGDKKPANEAASRVNAFVYAPSAYSQVNIAASHGDAETVRLAYAGDAKAYVGDTGGVGAEKIAAFWVQFYQSCPIKALQRNLERYVYGTGTFADSGSVKIITTSGDTVRATYRTHWKLRPADQGPPQIVFDSIALKGKQLRCK